MSNIEEKPLHEVILDIMYFKDTEKPFAFTSEDIFWQMKDPNISERQIIEVLDWLVVQKKAEKRFGKYQIDRYEFIDIANKYRSKPVAKDKTPTKVEVVKKVSVTKPTPKPRPRKTIKPKEKWSQKRWIFFALLFVLLCYIGYRLYNAPTLISSSQTDLKTTEIQVPEALYVPIDRLQNQSNLSKKQIENISYSFVKQNKTNKIIVEKLNKQNSKIIMLEQEFNKFNQSYQKQKENDKILFISFLGVLVLFGIFLLFFFKN